MKVANFVGELHPLNQLVLNEYDELVNTSYTSRVVADHTALVPDIICECGGHSSAP